MCCEPDISDFWSRFTPVTFFFLGATRARGGRTKAFRSLAARIEGGPATGEHTTTLENEE